GYPLVVLPAETVHNSSAGSFAVAKVNLPKKQAATELCSQFSAYKSYRFYPGRLIADKCQNSIIILSVILMFR
ncbi:MAG: hypothetical protein ABFR62_13965, partial [Bacteroidota bacterium]